MRLSRVFAVAFIVLLVLALIAYVSAVSSREVNTMFGDETLDLGAVYGFIALAAIALVAFGAALTWERSRMGPKASRSRSLRAFQICFPHLRTSHLNQPRPQRKRRPPT